MYYQSSTQAHKSCGYAFKLNKDAQKPSLNTCEVLFKLI